MNLPILQTIGWSKAELVSLKSGEQKFVQTADVPDGFFDVWKSHKDQIRATGISMSKDDRTGEWKLKLWTPLGQSPAPVSQAPAQAPTHAVPENFSDPALDAFNATAAKVDGWPGHDVTSVSPPMLSPHAQSVADELNDAIPDFASGEVPQRVVQATPPTVVSPEIGDWLRNAPPQMQLETAVRVACETIGSKMAAREVLVILAKVANGYKATR